MNYYAGERGFLQRNAHYTGEKLLVAQDISLSTYFSAYEVYIHNHSFYILRTPEGLWVKREGDKLICTIGYKDAAIFDFENTPNYEGFVNLVCDEWSTYGKARTTAIFATPHNDLEFAAPIDTELHRLGSVVPESAETKYFFAIHEPMAGRSNVSLAETHLPNTDPYKKSQRRCTSTLMLSERWKTISIKLTNIRNPN